MFMFYILRFMFYLLCLTFTFHVLRFTFYHLPFTVFDVHGLWLMAGKSLVSLAALLVEILDMTGEGGEGGKEEVQVITMVTLNLWVWGSPLTVQYLSTVNVVMLPGFGRVEQLPLSAFSSTVALHHMSGFSSCG